MAVTDDMWTRILRSIHQNPGKDGVTLISTHGLLKRDARVIRELEKLGYVVFKSGGWYLTGKGDTYLMERAS